MTSSSNKRKCFKCITVKPIITDRLERVKAQSILDIGCSAGQLASLLRDKGIPHYLGLDFSSVRIEYARQICPEYSFVVADVFETALIKTHPYDTFLAIEFLEHVEDDLALVEMIRPGSRVLISVPSFPNMAHIRHFNSMTEVRQRYEPYLQHPNITELLLDPQGRKFYLIEGVRCTVA